MFQVVPELGEKFVGQCCTDSVVKRQFGGQLNDTFHEVGLVVNGLSFGAGKRNILERFEIADVGCSESFQNLMLRWLPVGAGRDTALCYRRCSIKVFVFTVCHAH